MHLHIRLKKEAQTEDVVVFPLQISCHLNPSGSRLLSARPQSALTGDWQVLGPAFHHRRTGVQTINIPVCSLEVRSCRLHRLKFRQLPLAAVWRHPSAEVAWCRLLTKPADYWTKIKHLPTNLWTGSQTTERTAILRSLFSCLLLWFDWAGEPCLVPPKSAEPGSNKPQYLTAVVRLAEAGRFNLPTVPPSLVGLLQPRCFFSFMPLPPEDLIRNKCFGPLFLSLDPRKQKHSSQNGDLKTAKPTGKQPEIFYLRTDAFVNTALLDFSRRVDVCNVQTWRRATVSRPW